MERLKSELTFCESFFDLGFHKISPFKQRNFSALQLRSQNHALDSLDSIQLIASRITKSNYL